MHRGHQHAGRNADGLDGVVCRRASSVRQDAQRLREDGDDPRRGFQEGLLPVGAKRFERLKPRLRRAMFVEFFLFGFSRNADLPLQRRIADGNEMPGLQISAARRRAGCTNAMLDQLLRNRSVREIAHGSTFVHHRVEVLRSPDELLVRAIVNFRRWDEARLFHCSNAGRYLSGVQHCKESGNVATDRQKEHMITIRSTKNVSGPTPIGFEATISTPAAVYEFCSNGAVVDSSSPFAKGLFGSIALPRSRFQIGADLMIEQKMFISGSNVAISWELRGQTVSARLVVRPYFAGCTPRSYRDIGFHFESEQNGGRLAWLPNVRGPKIIADTNGRYVDEPLSLAERVKPRDDEQLLAPGRFEFQLSRHPSVLIFSTDCDAKTRDQQQIGAFLAGLLQESRKIAASENSEAEKTAHTMAA